MKRKIMLLVTGLVFSMLFVRLNTVSIYAITQDEMLQMIKDHGGYDESLIGMSGAHPELYNGDTTGTENSNEAAPTPEPTKEVQSEQAKTDKKTETAKEKTCTHNYTETLTKEATCTEDGVKTYTCNKCGDTYTAPIQATDHTVGEWEIVKEPTCTEKGQRVQKCTVCGAILNTEDIDMIEHTSGEWEIKLNSTLTHKGIEVQKCTVCGAILNEREIPINMTSWYIIIGISAATIGILTFVIIRIRQKNKALIRKHIY